MTAFIIWSVVGLFFVIMGIYCICSKRQKEFGFWTNADSFPVNDVKKYNAAVGKLWISFGVLFIISGLPLLKPQETVSYVITILGTVFLVLALMVVYVVVIESKYREKK